MTSDTLADFREDEQENEAQQERLDQGTNHELAQILLQHNEVAQQ
jgi:hypothetical protein